MGQVEAFHEALEGDSLLSLTPPVFFAFDRSLGALRNLIEVHGIEESLSNLELGFTIVDEDELDTVQEVKKTAVDAGKATKNTQDQLDKLYNAIIPLLNNLKSNPEKDYILWPKRLAKVEAFETMLTKIYKG